MGNVIWRLLIGGLWKPIAALVALLGVWVAGKRSATQAAKIDGLRATVETMETRNEVDNRIASERDARKRLHDDWSE